MNILGIDWGKSKIGLAIGSTEVRVASPFKVLKITDFENLIKQIIDKENVELIVLGKPVSLSGETNLSQEFNKFVLELEKLNLKIILEDERLSTRSAQTLSRDFKKTKRANDDDIAASVILQSYLDKI